MVGRLTTRKCEAEVGGKVGKLTRRKCEAEVERT